MTDQPSNALLSNDQIDSGLTQPDSSEMTDSANIEFRPIEFTGTASEYWGIWIVNLLLSVMTLGVYSAWAKVRRKKYFLNSTHFDGISLNYHATGGQLFVGRLTAFIIIVIESILAQVYLPAGLIMLAVFIFLLPWVLNRSMRFNARMTSWRNVRFNWHGTYWKSFAVMWLSTPLGIISLGIMIPIVSRWVNQYYVRKHSFGTTLFRENANLAPFVWAFLTVLLIVGVIGLGLFLMTATNPATEPLAIVLFGLVLIAAYSMYRTMCRNIMVQSLALGDAVMFRSSLSPTRVCWILATNILISVVSLGLMVPWAHIRIYRYLSNNTSYGFVKDADEFIDEERKKLSSFGEEFAELEGLDFSL